MTKVTDLCPKCGSHLILKDGQFGEFLACPRFPECRFTKPDRDDIQLYRKPSPYCKKCNHTGLLPLIKDNKAIAHAFIDCECKLAISECFDPVRLQPRDFDYPMSATFRAASFEYCNQQDPGSMPLVPDLTNIEDRLNDLEAMSADRGSVPRAFQQLRAQVLYLKNKVDEMRTKRKPKGEY